MTMGPLKGLKVLDLSRLLPGPLCTHFLVRMGAQVVKVEQPDGADYVGNRAVIPDRAI